MYVISIVDFVVKPVQLINNQQKTQVKVLLIQSQQMFPHHHLRQSQTSQVWHQKKRYFLLPPQLQVCHPLTLFTIIKLFTLLIIFLIIFKNYQIQSQSYQLCLKRDCKFAFNSSIFDDRHRFKDYIFHETNDNQRFDFRIYKCIIFNIAALQIQAMSLQIPVPMETLEVY